MTHLKFQSFYFQKYNQILFYNSFFQSFQLCKNILTYIIHFLFLFLTSHYLNFLYNDKGFLNLGIVKGTTENLQGVPEARLLGFPASIPMVGGFAAGTAGAIIGAKTAPRTAKIAGRSVMGGVIGSAVGVAMGHAVNETIAAANRQKLPKLSEYQQQDNI